MQLRWRYYHDQFAAIQTLLHLDAFLVPIDACYAFVGQVRLAWRGLSGGAEAQRAVADFVAGLRARSRPLHREA